MCGKVRHKIGSGFSPFSPCAERFVTGGYREPVPLEKQMDLAAGIKGLAGVALDYPCQFGEEDISRVKSMVKKNGQTLCTLEIGIYPDKKWKHGSITSPDKGIRRDAIQLSKKTLDIAAIMDVENVLFWPGQDGFDYPFQTDYVKAWSLLIEGLQEIGEYRKEIRIGIEYKPKEPRTNLFIRNAGILLHVIRSVGLPNVGGVVDFGHSLVAGENPAEAAVLLSKEGKLFEVHLNDNYRDYDHDLIVGTVSFWETLEFFYWLDRLGYRGWYLMDVFPYRENGQEALQQSVYNTVAFKEAAAELKKTGMEGILKKRDILAASALLREKFFRTKNR